MKRLSLFMASAAGLLLAGVPQYAFAGCAARARVVRQNVAVVEAVVTPVIATFVPIAVAVPQYSISYQPPAAPPAAPTIPTQTPPTRSETDLLKEKIEALQKQLDAIKGPPAKPAPVMPAADAKPPTAEIPPYLAILRAKCATCHEAAVAKAKGGDLVLLQGDQLSALDDKRVCKLASSLYTGRMPKGGKLSDEEVAEVISWIDSRK